MCLMSSNLWTSTSWNSMGLLIGLHRERFNFIFTTIKHDAAKIHVCGVLERRPTSFLIMSVILSPDREVDGPQGRSAPVVSHFAGTVLFATIHLILNKTVSHKLYKNLRNTFLISVLNEPWNYYPTSFTREFWKHFQSGLSMGWVTVLLNNKFVPAKAVWCKR